MPLVRSPIEQHRYSAARCAATDARKSRRSHAPCIPLLPCAGTRTLRGKSAAAAGEGLILAADRQSPRTVNDTLTVAMACCARCPEVAPLPAAPAAQIGEDAAAAGT
jgi:hypothetical protein